MRERVLPSLVFVGQECPTYITNLVRGVAIHLLLITEKFWVTLFAQNFSHIIKLYLIYPSILSEIFLFTPVSTASFATLTAFLIA